MASRVLLAYPSAPTKKESDIVRPIADFHPCVWGDQFLNYTPNDEEVIGKRKSELESLKSELTKDLHKTTDKTLEKLILIDTIERLGVSYHFAKDIEDVVKQMYDAYHQEDNLDLYHTSLRFRILRQHGYYVLSDIFSRFTDEQGNFLESLKNDVAGLLSLYDAAYLRGNKEEILDKAVQYTTAHLKVIVAENNHPLVPHIARTLVYPVQKGVALLESRHFISFYESDPSHNASLLRFSKLEFDYRQSVHKEELQDLTRWWRTYNFKRTLPFIRDRVVEAYLYSTAIFLDPKLSMERKVYTKAFLIVTIMDDIYDSYGTIEELEAFTEAIGRWDKSSIDELPDYMKFFYEVQYDVYEQFEDDLVKLGCKNYVHFAVREVIVLCKAYLQEAKWRTMKYVPTFDEYYINALKSSAINLLVSISIMFNYIEVNDAKHTFDNVSKYCKAQKATCNIGRFMDDLVDHKWDKHRDHVAGGVDCYIKQYGVSEEEAFTAINLIIENAWRDTNEEIFDPTGEVARPLLHFLVDFDRVMDFVFKYENSYTVVSKRMKEEIKFLFIEPISI